MAGYQQNATVPSKRGDIGVFPGNSRLAARLAIGPNQENPMSKTSTAIALAAIVVLNAPVTSFAQNTGASGGAAAGSGSAVGTPNWALNGK
jgi:hypothetical protein